MENKLNPYGLIWLIMDKYVLVKKDQVYECLQTEKYLQVIFLWKE